VNIALAALFFFILHLVVSVVIQRSFSLVAVETILLFPAHCPLSPPSELRLQRRDGDAKPWRFLRALRHDRRPINLRIAPAAFFFSLLLLLLFSLVGSIIKRVISVVAIQTILLLPTHCPLRPLAQLGLQMRHGHAEPWRLFRARWHDRRPLDVRIAFVALFFLLARAFIIVIKQSSFLFAVSTVLLLPAHCPLRPLAKLRLQRWRRHAKPWRFFQAMWHDRRPLNLRIALAVIFLQILHLLLFNLMVNIIKLVIGIVAVNTILLTPTHCPLRPVAERRLQRRHGNAKPWHLFQVLRHDRRPLGPPLAPVSLLLLILLLSLLRKIEVKLRREGVHGLIQGQAGKRCWRGRTDLRQRRILKLELWMRIWHLTEAEVVWIRRCVVHHFAERESAVSGRR